MEKGISQAMAFLLKASGKNCTLIYTAVHSMTKFSPLHELLDATSSREVTQVTCDKKLQVIRSSYRLL